MQLAEHRDKARHHLHRKCLFQNIIAYAIGVAMVWLMLGGSAAAHKVSVFAWVEGDTVYAQGLYFGGKKIADGQVMVYDDEKSLLVEGRTDKEGLFAFKIPRKTDLTIIIKPEAGHQGLWVLHQEELTPGTDQIDKGPGRPPAVYEKADQGPDQFKRAAGSGDLEKTVKKVLNMHLESELDALLDRKLQPITRTLNSLRQERVTLKDVIGGIGYILGLIGLGAYIHYRKQKP